MDPQIETQMTPGDLPEGAPPVSEASKKKKSKKLLIWIGVILILGIATCTLGPFVFFYGEGFLVRHSWPHPPVDVSPILDMTLPDDMDLSQWEEHPEWRGVSIDIKYFQTIEEADQEFLRPNYYTYTSGESPNRYRLSDVDETTDEFGHGYGTYNSKILIQKGKYIIKIEEVAAENKDSKEIERTIAKLASEWNEAIQSGDYKKMLLGRLIFEEQCEGCHSIKVFTDPLDRYTSEWGPNLYSLYGSQEELIDGSCIQVDEKYLQQSILDPSRKVVFWWGIGGHFGGMRSITLSTDDVDQLVKYLASLADREFPCRERPAVAGESDIVGIWQNFVRRVGATVTIKGDGLGNYTIFSPFTGSGIEGEFRYDSDKGIYTGRFWFENQWTEWGSLTIQLRDASTMFLTEDYGPGGAKPTWLFVRRGD